MKSNTGATTGIRAVLAATNGACATTPVDPMTADPTPVPMVISVWGLTVARNTLPASRDDAAVLPAPRSGGSQVLSITPADWNGRAAGHDARSASLASRPRSTRAIFRVSLVRENLSNWALRYLAGPLVGDRGCSCVLLA